MKKIFKYFGLFLPVVLLGALTSCIRESGDEAAELGLGIKVFFPTKVVAGTPMTINGSGLSDVTEIVFPGSVTVTDFEVVGDGMLRLKAPAGIAAEGGPLTVRTAADEAVSSEPLTVGNPLVTGYSKQAGEEVELGELFSIYGQDLEFLSSVELLDADGNTFVIPETLFYRKGTSTVTIKVPMNTLEGTFPGKVKSINGKTFDIPELTYKAPAGGGHWENQEITLYEGESVFDSWSSTLVINAAAFADAVEGGIIRVFYKDRGDDYLPIYKHVSDWSDWTSLQDAIAHEDGYFEAPIAADALDELKSEGLRFQGLGFTITKVVLIQDVWIPEEGGGEEQKEEVLWDTETVFDGWSATIVIEAAKFAQAKEGNTIRVFVKDKGSDYNPIFKHMDWSDWTEFQDIINKDPDDYFESTVTEAVLDELKTDGLRFQGVGFTLVEVRLIP